MHMLYRYHLLDQAIRPSTDDAEHPVRVMEQTLLGGILICPNAVKPTNV